MDILVKYRIEPRSKCANKNSSSSSWLVLYDKINNKYLTKENSLEYIKFNNSDEIYKYLKEMEED